MTMNAPKIEAKSRPKLWPMFVLAPVSVGLAWCGYDISMRGEVAQIRGRGAWIGKMDPTLAMTFFFAIALLCAALAAMVLKRYFLPAVMLRMNESGVSTFALGGRGHLAWPEVMRLETQGPWLFLHGTKAGQSKSRRLAVNLTELDQPADAVMAALQHYRPGFFAG